MRAPIFDAERFVAWTLRHGRTLWLIAIVLAVPATLRTGWLYAHLRSELEELLPRESPSVVALDELGRRAGGHHYLGVVVDAGSRDRVPAAEAFLDDLAARVRAYPAGLIADVRTGDDEESAFLDRNGFLYMDAEDLRVVRDRVASRRDFEVARETGALLDADEPVPPLDFHDLQAKYRRRFGGDAEQRGVRYTSADKHLSVLLLELGDGAASIPAERTLLERVQADAAGLGGPARYAPGMRVGYAGDATIAVEELSALVADLSLSSIVVLVAVVGAIVLYYRWWRSVLIVVPPLLLATVYAFGAASLPPFEVTAVNSNTAFLASIIVGNGINFGLILLGRYVEERRLGIDVCTSLARAVAGARSGTLAAAAAAAVSYGALALTQFRGFRQFGFIGGLGMIFAWVLAFVLMPSLIAWLDRDESTRPKPGPEGARLSFWIARAVARAPSLVFGLTIVVTVISLVEVCGFRSTDIESDFSRLRRRDTWVSGEGYWGDRMNEVLGRYLTPMVFLTDSPEQASAVAARLRDGLDRAPFAGRIDSVRTIADVLPADQDAKIALAQEIDEELTPRVRASLNDDQRTFVERFDQGSQRVPVTVDKLPRTFTLGLRESDGTLGKLVLVYPVLNAGWWDADQMRSFVAAMRALGREAVGAGNRAPRFAGSVPLSSDIVEAIRHDGPLASGAALTAVVAVVVALLRRRRATVYVVASLCVGVLWLAGGSRLLGIHVNFANFIAFPITFGIGVDYAVNVVSRYEQDGSVDPLAAIRSTGAAVALCSLTTIIGYSSLLMAENRALYLFGLLAVLGEAACLSVALVSLPAFLILWQRGARGTALRGGLETAPPGSVQAQVARAIHERG
jgi:predicted RND superfamily exporter protein